MLIANYIGNHAKDTWPVRAGNYITRLAQKGPYGHVTHTEAIHALNSDGSVTIASSSLRDGGVRPKEKVVLTLGNWMIVDVPQWDVQKSIDLLAKTKGQKYDIRGALATQLPGSPQAGRWFCNQWVGFPYIKAAATFGPHQFCAITLTMGQDVTAEYFASRNAA